MAAERKYDWGGGGGGGGAGARGFETADYPREASACEGQELPPLPPRFRRPCPAGTIQGSEQAEVASA